MVDSDITITGGTSYDGKYVRFSLTNGQSTDVLSLNSAANVNASGAISFSGVTVYLGNGTLTRCHWHHRRRRERPGGPALEINFVSTFTNSSFESGLAGWTPMNR